MEDLQNEITCLLKKNHKTTKQFDSLLVKYEKMQRNNKELEKLKCSLKIFEKNYPEINFEKLIQTNEYLEKTSLELTNTVINLEYDQKKLEKDKFMESTKFDENYLNFNKINKSQIKEIKSLQKSIELKEDENKGIEKFKENYINIYNRILTIFSNWSCKLKIYYNPQVIFLNKLYLKLLLKFFIFLKLILKYYYFDKLDIL